MTGRMPHRLMMIGRLFTGCAVAMLVGIIAAPPVRASDEVMLFRIFLTDGTSVVSYGEFARVGDEVFLSMPVGGTPDEPRLHALSIPASQIDWERTDRHATSARYQRYVATRAESDYQQLTDAVASVLSNIAQTSDRSSALASAKEARRMLTEWPRLHYGYRQQDVQDIVRLLDSAIARLQGTAPPLPFQIALVSAPALTSEPPAVMPTAGEQVDQLLTLARLSTDITDRVAMLRSALALLSAPDVITDPASAALRRTVATEIERVESVDRRYTRLAQDLVARATRAAAEARIADVREVLERIPREDARLGRQRPDLVQALTASVQAQLDNARQLRLLRDQWQSRQAIFREYQRSVGIQIVQLVKAQPALEAIRRLEGPPPAELNTLHRALTGGSTRLDRLRVPDYLRGTHDLVIGAWRFAETAASARLQAVASGEIATAWEASSAAAGALMMLSRAQKELRDLLEPPRLQ